MPFEDPASVVYSICQHPWLFPLRTSLNMIFLVQVMVVTTTYYYHDFFFILIEVTSLAQTVLFCAALEGPVSLWHATNRPRQGCIPVYYDSAVGCHTNPWLQHSFENEESNLICLYIPVYEVVYWHLECIIHEKFKHMHLQTHTK